MLSSGIPGKSPRGRMHCMACKPKSTKAAKKKTAKKPAKKASRKKK
jgi:hypothetical protein